MEELENIIQSLRQNPLFYISQASKELFHSNFWEWLAELNTPETINIFSNMNDAGENYFFKREHNQSSNRIVEGENVRVKSKNDFVLFRIEDENTEPVIVIENKVKDYPSTEQLDRIRESFNNDQIEYILVTLFWEDGIHFEGWNNVIRYNDIANNIHPENYNSNEFGTALIASYKDFCNELHALAELLPINNLYDFTYSFNFEFLQQLNRIKMAEGYLKMRSSHFLLNYQKPYDFIKCSYSINNQKATISFSYPLIRDYSIGVQLEDKQFRIFVQGINRIQFAENLRNIPLFFSNTWVSPSGLPFLGYRPDFTYQFENVDENKSFDLLYNEINTKLSFIHANRQAIELQIP